MISIKRTQAPFLTRRRLPALTMLPLMLGLLLAAPSAFASAVAVNDQKTQEKINDKINELRDKLTKLEESKITSWKSLALVDDEAGLFKDLAKIDDARIIKEVNWECGETYSGSVSDLLKRYEIPEPNTFKEISDYSKAQRAVCQHVVATRLSRANLTVRLRERLVEHEKLLNSILEKTDAVQRGADLAAFSAVVQADLNYTQAAFIAYDARTNELDGQRSQINELALRGADKNDEKDFMLQATTRVGVGAATLWMSLEASRALVNALDL